MEAVKTIELTKKYKDLTAVTVSIILRLASNVMDAAIFI